MTKIDNIEVDDSERQKCEVWTRVMGYHRPTHSFNIGKQSEFKERVPFNEPKEITETNLRKEQGE